MRSHLNNGFQKPSSGRQRVQWTTPFVCVFVSGMLSQLMS
jgi:hypothetical protein